MLEENCPERGKRRTSGLCFRFTRRGAPGGHSDIIVTGVIVVPFRGEIFVVWGENEFEPHPENEILVALRFFFSNILTITPGKVLVWQNRTKI